MMDRQTSIFVNIHRQLLSLLVEARSVPTGEVRDLVSQQMAMIWREIKDQEDHSALVCFRRYEDYFVRRFNDPSMRPKYAVDDLSLIEQKLTKDPSRYDLLLAQVMCYLSEGRTEDARFILRKIATSGYREAADARQLLGQLCDAEWGLHGEDLGSSTR